MAGPTKAQIEARLRELEEENSRLREALEENARLREESVVVEELAAAPVAKPRARGRAVLGIVLIVLGTLLAPLSTVVGFAARQVSSTETFVHTLGPLATDPAVQALIVDEGTAAIDDALETDALVEELLASVIDEASTPRLAAAADVLGPLLADQARVAIRSALTLVVESDAFATVWEQSLRLTHAQLVGVLEGGDGAVAIDDSGVVAIQLQPIIAELKPALVDAGFTLADSIPEVEATITVAEVPAIAKARLAYSLLTTASTVLAWASLGLLILGVVVHPRRPRAVVVAGVLLLVIGGVLGLTISLGGSVAAALVATQIPTAATAAIYGALTGETAAVMLAFVALGVVAIVAGALSGSSSAASRARASGSGSLSRGTAALDARGWRPEGVPAVLRRHGWLLWVWLGLVLLLLFATLRPLSPWDVLLGTVVLGVAAALYGVLRGGDDAVDASDDGTEGLPT